MTTNGSTGTTGIDLTGNEFVQSITGNAGANRLEGKGGSDTLRGLGGNDTFVFASTIGAVNVDTIVDFNVADDRFPAVRRDLQGADAGPAVRKRVSGQHHPALPSMRTTASSTRPTLEKLFYDARWHRRPARQSSSPR